MRLHSSAALVCAWVAFGATNGSESAGDDVSTIIGRIRALSAVPSNEQPDFDIMVSSYISLIMPNGQFSDINYTISEASYWPTLNHTVRARAMARAYESTNSQYYMQAAFLERIVFVVDWWLRADPQNSNWWYQSIGTPEQLSPPLLTLQAAGALAPNQTKAALKILSVPSTGPGTDANVVWESVNMIFCGLFNSNATLLTKASNILWGTGV